MEDQDKFEGDIEPDIESILHKALEGVTLSATQLNAILGRALTPHEHRWVTDVEVVGTDVYTKSGYYDGTMEQEDVFCARCELPYVEYREAHPEPPRPEPTGDPPFPILDLLLDSRIMFPIPDFRRPIRRTPPSKEPDGGS